jgi:hypothetical protein
MNTSLAFDSSEFGDPRIHSRWEFMSFWKFYALVIPIWVWYSIKNRTFFLGTNLNSFLNNGGLFNYDKKTSNDYFHFINKTSSIQLRMPHDVGVIENELIVRNKIVLKPSQGLRGKSIFIIEDKLEIPKNLEGNYILESFHCGAKEISVLVSRTAEGLQIDGITGKVFPHVIGDGISSIKMLIQEIHRYRIAGSKLALPSTVQGDYIPKKGERISLGRIGNHNRGCLFVDITISLGMEAKIGILKTLESAREIDFGRFDINYNHPSDLVEGRFKVIEFNGAMAEPTHMYDPRYSLMDALSIYRKHIQRLSRCHADKKKKGHSPTPLWRGLRELKVHWKHR